ncbi:hypothetical protein K7I13_06405 [Brucepastera parasyntrophica]|uniref:hypothetical protein n=1 Tax=Brucepastera parasyntrophica TaxID=2880008 RepID=UPI0021088542|nr:hypothetical protein [Brucepastera parasyntrophica]ULQ60890.1 hypothetical protein K7I13_06405 [Brucepastera parasyntrophica]
MTFLVNLVVWFFVLPFCLLLTNYDSLIALASGNFSFFLIELLGTGLYLLPVSLMLSFLVVFLFLMRHKTIRIISVSITVLLFALSVAIILPVGYRLYNAYSPALARAREKTESVSNQAFSSGHIRAINNYYRAVWYHTSEDGERISPVIIADTRTRFASPHLSIYSEASYNAITKTARMPDGLELPGIGGRDPHIVSYLRQPAFIASFLGNMENLLESFRSALAESYLRYIFLAGSFFLAFGALWGFCYLTDWRMLNVLLLITAFLLLFFIYPYISGGPFFNLIAGVLPVPADAGIISSCCYILISVILFFCELFIWLKRKLRTKGENRV